MEDLRLLTNAITTLEQRIEEHLRRDQGKDAQIAELTAQVTQLQARVAEYEDPNRNTLLSSLLQRIAVAADKL